MKTILNNMVLEYGEYRFTGLMLMASKLFKNNKELNAWVDSKINGGTESDKNQLIDGITSILNNKLHVQLTWNKISKVMPFVHMSIAILMYHMPIVSAILMLSGALWFLVRKITRIEAYKTASSIESRSDVNLLEFYFTPDGREYLKLLESKKK